MQRAIIFTTEETKVWNSGEGEAFDLLYQDVCEYFPRGLITLDVALLGKDDDREPLYDLDRKGPSDESL